jgi:hypothetical protein
MSSQSWRDREEAGRKYLNYTKETPGSQATEEPPQEDTRSGNSRPVHSQPRDTTTTTLEFRDPYLNNCPAVWTMVLIPLPRVQPTTKRTNASLPNLPSHWTQAFSLPPTHLHNISNLRLQAMVFLRAGFRIVVVFGVLVGRLRACPLRYSSRVGAC